MTINKTQPCSHCGRSLEHHRGIEQYCQGTFATSYWVGQQKQTEQTINARFEIMWSVIDHMAQEIEKIKATINK